MYLIGVPDIPRVRPQLLADVLGASPPATAGANCNVKVTQACIEFATHGLIYPTVKQVRDAMGAPSGGTSSGQAIAAMAHFGVTATRLATFAQLEAAWADPDQFVSIAVDYAYVNDSLPWLSGDRGCRTWHRIGTYGAEQVKSPGPVWVIWDDPLHDARVRDDKPYPKGHVMAKRVWIEAAMEATGLFSALTVKR